MYPHEPFWRRRKLSRTEWRKRTVGKKKRAPHGGRGRKYGLKGGHKKKNAR